MNARTISIEGDYIDASGADDPDLNQAFWDFAESIKQEADAGGSVAVFEVPVDANGTPRPTTYNKTKLFTVPIGTMTLDDICDRVLREFVEPGGKIMIQLLARKNGERGVKLNRMIPLKRAKVLADSGAGPSQIENLMRIMNEQRARDLSDMRAMIERTQTTQVDPMQQALAITAKLTEMAVAMRSGQAPGTVAPANDPNAMMNQMMTMMMGAMMKNFLKGMDGSKADAPPESDSWLKEIVGLAKPLLEAKAAAEQTNAAHARRLLRHETQAPAPTESNAGAPKHTEPSQKEQNDMKLLALLNSALPMIIDSVVKQGGDAVSTAKLLMDELPEDDVGLNDALYQLIQSPPAEFIAKLALADKRVGEHAQWFEQLRVALLAEFDPDARMPQTGSAP